MKTALEGAAYGNHELRSALPEILSAHERDRTSSMRDPNLISLDRIPMLPMPDIQREALAVYSLPNDRIRQPARLQIHLRIQMRLHHKRLAIARERKRRVVDMLDPDALGGVDGGVCQFVAVDL